MTSPVKEEREGCPVCEGHGEVEDYGVYTYQQEYTGSNQMIPCCECDGSGKADGRSAPAVTKDGGGSSGPGVDEGDVYALVKAATKTLEMLDAVGYEDQYHGKGELREALAPFRAPVENGSEA